MSTRPTLATLLRSVPRRDVVAFVAALYDARDVGTRVEGAVVVVDGDRYLVVEAGLRARLRRRVGSRTSPSDAVDTVVAVDPTRADALGARYDASVLTPTDLDQLARHGIDRTVADEVFREFFDRPVDAVAPPPRPRAESAPRTPERDSSDGRPPRTPAPTSGHSQSAVLAVLFVAALVAFGVAASPAVGPGIGALAGVDEVTQADASDPGAAADEAGVANEPRPTTTPLPDRLSLAPGLSIEGVVDARTLAETHARTLANRSYTWELTYVEFSNGNESGRAREVVRVESPTVYTSHVTTDGFLSSRGPISLRPSYADGDQRHRPTVDGVASAPIQQRGVTGRQETRAIQYYGVLLEGEETSVVRTIIGEPRIYVVDIQGTSASSVRNYTATAHVAPDGVVAYYFGSYCYVSFSSDSGRETCLTLTMQYRNVGQTTVDPPAWYTGSASTPTPEPTSTLTEPTSTLTEPTSTPTEPTSTPTAPTAQTNETASRPTVTPSTAT